MKNKENTMNVVDINKMGKLVKNKNFSSIGIQSADNGFIINTVHKNSLGEHFHATYVLRDDEVVELLNTVKNIVSIPRNSNE